jgi:PAS domain-containing protein
MRYNLCHKMRIIFAIPDIVRCSGDAIFSVTMERVIQTWNAGAEQILLI